MVFCRLAPMPEYEPRSFSSKSWTSLGVRYTVYGSLSDLSMPLTPAVESLSTLTSR